MKDCVYFNFEVISCSLNILSRNTFLSFLFLQVMLLLPNTGNAQLLPYSSAKDSLETYLLRFDSKNALDLIYNIEKHFNNDYTTSEQVNILTYKVQGLRNADLFADAGEVALQILENYELSDTQKAHLFTQMSLNSELLSDFDEALNLLEKAGKIYDEHPEIRDQKYGEYLYRNASLNRVTDHPEAFLEYTQKALDYGKENNYEDVIAVSSMLMSFHFVKEDPAMSRKYMFDALEAFKQFKDYHGISAMYANIAKGYKLEKKLDLSMHYLDSAQQLSELPDYIVSTGDVYFRKSELFEQLNQPDSALFYYQLFHEKEEAEKYRSQALKLALVNRKFVVEKERLAKNALKEEVRLAQSKNQLLVISLIVFGLLSAFLINFSYLLRRRSKALKQKNNIIHQNLQRAEASEQQKAMLLRELNHRVKNNLALIMGLLQVQAADTEDEKALTRLQDLETRIGTIALTHEMYLYNLEGKAFEQIELRQYCEKIIFSLTQLYNNPIHTALEVDDYSISIDRALPLGILITELVTNSIKHAVISNELKVALKIEKTPELYTLEYSDNGAVFETQSKKTTLGLSIINSMVEQLNGELKRAGSHYFIRVKLNGNA